MGASQPRLHHFVPAFYLARFTDTARRNGKLWVFDQTNGRQWPTTPDNAAAETDYYRARFKDGSDEFQIEKTLAELEGKVAPVCDRTIQSGQVPSGPDLNLLLNFVTLLAVRGPRLRTQVDTAHLKVAEAINQTLAKNPKAYESAMAEVRARGKRIPNVPHEAIKRFIEEKRYKLSVTTEPGYYIKQMVDLSGSLLALLHQRNWSLTVCGEDAPDLICSDSPVSISALPETPASRPLGFGVPGTLVALPLTKRLLLGGILEQSRLDSPLRAPTVAHLNSMTGRSSVRFIYSSAKDFSWTDHEGRIAGSAELAEFFRQKNSS